MHSGLQLGGEPVYSGKQEQDGEPFISLHWAFGPQGDGMHGLSGSTTGSATKKLIIVYVTLRDFVRFYLSVNIWQMGLHYI